MGLRKTFLEAIEVTERLLNDVIFMCESRTKPTYFTRKGKNKLDFRSIILFSLFFVKKSLQLELDDFFKMMSSLDISITKQGYSEARRKISPSAFIKLTQAVVQWFYEDNSFKTYHGYRLCAVDGSVFEVPNTETLRNYFGCVRNKTITYARAMATCIYDIENDMILTSRITTYTSSERHLAMEMILELKELGSKRDLILFDRGYPSKELMFFLEKNQIKYVMRTSRATMKEIKGATDADQMIRIKVKEHNLTARVLRFQLDSGEEEVLVTNLMEENFGIPEFKALYFKRWGIEVKYNGLKNKLQIENFTGSSPIAIEQDFYASMYLANMVSILKNEANETIIENTKGKQLGYEYSVNINIVIGKLKNTLIPLLLEKRQRVRRKIFQCLLKGIIKNKTPYRPGRSYPRNKVLKSNKYSINQKRCL